MTLKVDVPDTRQMDRDTLEHWVLRLHGMVESQDIHAADLRERYKDLKAQNTLLLAIRDATEHFMSHDCASIGYTELVQALQAYDLTQTE